MDFTITASVKGAELKYEQAGDIANAAEIAKVKVKQYQARYDIGGGSHRLEGVTSHQERVRPVKERVGSISRNGDGEGGANDVHATSILGSRLGRQL